MAIPRSSRSLHLLPASSAGTSRQPRIIEPGIAPAELTGTSKPARELWLAIHLPHFMLDALGDIASVLRNPPPTVSEDAKKVVAQDDRRLPPAQAVAVVDLEHGGKVVCDRNATAAAAGVAPGMALNSVLALAPHITTLARDPLRETQLLKALAEWSLRFTSRVSLEPPDAVLLEVRGSLRLFGGARRLGGTMRRLLRAAGLDSSMSLTPTPLASLWIARAGEANGGNVVRTRTQLAGRLVSLPLAVTRWPERSRQTLATMGVRTVGECLRLPRDGFTRRFEPRMRLELDRALGGVADPRAAFVAAERFVARHELEPEIIDAGRLGPACEVLLRELCDFLQSRAAGIEFLELRLLHREGKATRLRLGFAEAVTTVPRIGSLLRERLDRLQLPQPVRAVRLRSGPLVDVCGNAGELFALDRRRASTAIPQLIERLRARLGNEAVHGLACVPEHRPEAAWRAIEPACHASEAANLRTHTVAKSLVAAIGASSSIASATRPLWLLEAPEACDGSGLVFEEGPECIESGWWDGHDVARDYYVARDSHGARLWVFRNRRQGASEGWFLHGWFA